MGLIIGIIIIIVGFILSLLINFANGMAAAPNADNAIPVWPWLIVCSIIGSLFIFSHYYKIS